MSPQLLILCLGGLVPAVLFGLFPILMKTSLNEGLSTTTLLGVVGVAVVLVSVISGGVFNGGVGPLPVRGVVIAATAGIAWGVGIIAYAHAIGPLNGSVSVVTTLINLNVLVSVGLGLWLFAEWQRVNLVTLAAGVVLVTIGSILVARA